MDQNAIAAHGAAPPLGAWLGNDCSSHRVRRPRSVALRPYGLRLVPATLLVLVVATFGAWVATNATSAAGGSDQCGYLLYARALRSGHVLQPIRPVPGIDTLAYPHFSFMPLGMTAGPLPGSLAPGYPIGFPLHLFVAARLVGEEHAGIAVQAAAGVALLLLVFAVARRLGLPWPWALGAVVLVGAFPVTLHFFTWMMSDGLAATWCTAAMLAALRAREADSWAILAGLAFGIAVLVRPTDVLIAGGLLLALPWRPRSLMLAALGAAPPVCALAALNLVLFGDPGRSGYGDMSTLFALEHLGPCLAHFAIWLSLFLTPLAVVLWGGSALRALRGDRVHLLLLAWLTSFGAFYAFYSYSDDAWWYLRFLLPGVPAFVLGATLVARELAERARRRWPGAAGRVIPTGLAVVCAVAATWSSLWWTGHFNVAGIARGQDAYRSLVTWADARVARPAVVVCMQACGAVYTYTSLPIARFDTTDWQTGVRMYGELRRAGTAVYALVFDHEMDRLRTRFPVAWRPIARQADGTLLRLDEP